MVVNHPEPRNERTINMRFHSLPPPLARAVTATRRACAELARRAACVTALALLGFAPLATAAVSVGIITSNATPTVGGGAFSWTITLTNGVGVASNVAMTFPLPPGAVFANLTVTGAAAGAYSCTGPAPQTNGTVSCEATSVAASAAATITVVAQYDADLAPGVRTAVVRVASGGTANFATIQHSMGTDVTLVMTGTSTATVSAGSAVIQRVQILNNGNSSAINALVQHTLPTGLTFNGLYAAGDLHGTCSFNPITRIITCQPRFLRQGEHSLTIVSRSNYDLIAGGISSNTTVTAPGASSISGSPLVLATTITN
jgi:uncharacterized repeat protein (TIGR01451 family)